MNNKMGGANRDGRRQKDTCQEKTHSMGFISPKSLEKFKPQTLLLTKDMTSFYGPGRSSDTQESTASRKLAEVKEYVLRKEQRRLVGLPEDSTDYWRHSPLCSSCFEFAIQKELFSFIDSPAGAGLIPFAFEISHAKGKKRFLATTTCESCSMLFPIV
jgi:hypothetical protein